MNRKFNFFVARPFSKLVLAIAAALAVLFGLARLAEWQ